MTKPAKVDYSLPEKALELRKQGLTYPQIAQALNRPLSTVHHAVMTLVREHKEKLLETADEVRELELGRLDTMMNAIWPKVEGGHLLSIDRALRIMERRAAYLGMDAPKRQEISGPDGQPIEIDERINLTIEERRARVVELIRAEIRPGGVAALPEPDLAATEGATDSSVA